VYPLLEFFEAPHLENLSCPEDRDRTFFRNVNKILLAYTASHPRRQ
jgi:hypothetical protein